MTAWYNAERSSGIAPSWPAQMLSISQSSEVPTAPKLRIAPQRPGTAWQLSAMPLRLPTSRSSGTASSTHAVPHERSTEPGLVTRIPTAAQYWSCAPLITGSPAGSPVAALASAVSLPKATPDGCSGESCSRRMPASISSQSSQSPVSMSSSWVMLASEGFMQSSPVRRRPMKSLTNRKCRERAKASGCSARSQRMCCNGSPAISGQPVLWEKTSPPYCLRNSACSACARPSIQLIAL